MSDTFEFIDAEYAAPHQNNNSTPSIVQMCVWTGVSRSGYYDWRNKPESATARRRTELKELIVHFFEASGGTYGYRRVHAESPGSAWIQLPPLWRTNRRSRRSSLKS